MAMTAQALHQLLAAGWTVAVIAEKVEASPFTLWRVMRSNGVSRCWSDIEAKVVGLAADDG